MTRLTMNLGERSYPITIGAGLLAEADKYLDLSRRVLIVTDDGVPREYAEKIAYLCKEYCIVTVKQGEGSKSPEVLTELLNKMCEMQMDRSDCAVAVGGGVVGDLTGFASSIYMRGIDFYNMPTTLLSQVDSSIGGKTAINLGGIKNIVGAFKQPCAVLIDTHTLCTLPKRHMANGLCEAIKMSLTSNAELFRFFLEKSEDEIYGSIEHVIAESLKIKRDVVEQDECESGLRRILNFGHTLGHGIEAEGELRGLYHGECVALGMLPMCTKEIKSELIKVLNKVGLPTKYTGDIDKALSYVTHDKKCKGGRISVVTVQEIGEANISSMTIDEFKNMIKNADF